MNRFVTLLAVVASVALGAPASAEMTKEEVNSAFREFFEQQQLCADEMEHSLAGIEEALPTCMLGAAASCDRMDGFLDRYAKESLRCSTEGERMKQKMEQAPALEGPMPPDILAAQVELRSRWGALIPRYQAAMQRVKKIER